MPHLHPRTWALLALLLLLPAAAAATPTAGCISPTSCLCGSSQRIVVQAKVLALQGEGAVVAIEAIDNPTAATTSLAEGATATVAYAVITYDVGDRFLGFAGANKGSVYAIVRIDADERVTCKYAPTFRPTVAEARAIMSAADCSAALVAHGFKSTGCVGSGVTRIGDEGACMAGRGSGGSGLAWFALGAVALLWRRRARVDRRG